MRKCVNIKFLVKTINNKQSNNKKLKYFVSKVFQYIILKQTNHKTQTTSNNGKQFI